MRAHANGNGRASKLGNRVALLERDREAATARHRACSEKVFAILRLLGEEMARYYGEISAQLAEIQGQIEALRSERGEATKRDHKR